MLNFFRHGTKCVRCGIEGTEFRVERHTHPGGFGKFGWHINLYAIKQNRDILMTADHIIPKSRGGTENILNLQPMCEACNRYKGNRMPSDPSPPKRVKPGTNWTKDKRLCNGWVSATDWKKILRWRWIRYALRQTLKSEKVYMPRKWKRDPEKAIMILRSKRRRKKNKLKYNQNRRNNNEIQRFSRDQQYNPSERISERSVQQV